MILTDSVKYILGRNFSTGFIALIMIYTIALSSAIAGEPEYMKLDYKVIPAVEVKGFWDSSGIFIATDIEELPKPRRPKLRGEIQAIDIKAKTITMYGIEIAVNDDTQFFETGEGEFSLEHLRAGQRVEISCKVDDSDNWKARKIKIGNIKKNDKIKGNITGARVDGDPPDTLLIHGLPILLRRDTDVNEPTSFYDNLENELFTDLSLADLGRHNEGFALGNRLLFNADYRQTIRSETEYDLADGISSDYNDTEPEIRLELAGYLNKAIQTFAQFRMRKKYPFRSDTTIPSQNLMVHITQMYILARDAGIRGLSLQIGRQDFDEPREWLFDDYLDAIRVYYYGQEPILFEAALMHALTPIKKKNETWTDIFAQVRWYFDKDNRLRGYFLLRRDSDDIRNREPVWWGIGYYGEVQNLLKPWVDIAILRGEDKGKTLRAAALDIGATFKVSDNRFAPSLTLSYALGSGDKTGGDGIDNDFRQTGYEDNVDYLGGVNTLRYYGEVLDPELSNLKILTFGLGMMPISGASFEFVYHSYRQHRLDDRIRGDLIDPPARPNGASDDIGEELDFILGLSHLWQRASLSWVFGLFFPGKAFAPYQKRASLNRLNLKIEL